MSGLSSSRTPSLSDQKIIVGVDFGTTFSGLAWAESRRVMNDLKICSLPISANIVVEGPDQYDRHMAFQPYAI